MGFSAIQFMIIAIGIAFEYKSITEFKDKGLWLESLKEKQTLSESQKKLLQMLSEGRPTEEILSELPHLKWVILDNNVYDLGNFFHPGGNFIIEAARGREVGRFLYGSYGIESIPGTEHKHSKKAFEILAKCYIGPIQNTTFIYKVDE